MLLIQTANCILIGKESLGIERKKMVGGGGNETSIDMDKEVINKACSMAMKAHKYSGKAYLVEKIRSSSSPSDVIIAFYGSGSVDDWFAGNSFGEMEIDLNLFLSVRSIGNDQTGSVNRAFYTRFKDVLEKSSLKNEVRNAMRKKRRIVFTGHSSGGPIAILATIWVLENYLKTDPNQISPRCVTFGSPLVGNRIFSHALNRENWSRHFIHFVMKYDIVPRIFLAPRSSIEQNIQTILNFFNPRSTPSDRQSIGRARGACDFYMTIMTNASSVASHAACNLFECTNLLLENISSFIELSPYTPFGKFIFCTGNGKLVTVTNSDAVLQLLFYSSQLSCDSETELSDVAYRSLNEHLVYERELKESWEMHDEVYLDHQKELPLSSDGAALDGMVTINTALNDLGLSTKARLCLRGAGEWENQIMKNQEKIDLYKPKIEEGLCILKEYQTKCENQKVGYYDAFKRSKNHDDFHANVKRLELAGMWDEIIEMLKRNALPDGFEGREEWIDLGTRYRRLVEPLDIANFYRHTKNNETGHYLNVQKPPRPKRYRYTQRWLENSLRKKAGSSSESCFWAEVERCKWSSAEAREKIRKMEEEVSKWDGGELLGAYVFWKESTFVEWWNKLPQQLTSASCIAHRMKS